jgi:hypothetical protein
LATKNVKLKDERLLQTQKEMTDLEAKITNKENLFKKETEYKTNQIERLTAKVGEM